MGRDENLNNEDIMLKQLKRKGRGVGRNLV